MSCSIDQFRERLVYQYRDSPRVVATVGALLSEYPDICDAQNQLLTRLDIDLSEGVQLDGIGEIVGRPRPNTEELEADDLFVMQGTDPGLGFSNLANPTIGGRFIGEDGDQLGPMPDQDYRVLLRAAIFGNYANASVQDIVDYVTFVLDARVFLEDGIGVVNFQFDRALRPFEDRIVRATVPLAAGVRVGTLTSYEAFILAGFSLQPMLTEGGEGILTESGAAIITEEGGGETLETSGNLLYEVIISASGT